MYNAHSDPAAAQAVRHIPGLMILIPNIIIFKGSLDEKLPSYKVLKMLRE